MMKVTMSLAVLALIGEISAVELKNHHKHHAKLHHKRHLRMAQVHKRAGKRSHASARDNFYVPTKDGADWFDLDDPTERLHGTLAEDEDHSDDPDVADAPEDIPRVGNSHEKLHNAVEQPEGYETGFTVKDAFGNYAQVNRRNILAQMNARNERAYRKRLHSMRRNFVQDHANDTDDILPEYNPLDYNQIQYNHEDDTEDIPDGFDPVEFNQRGSAVEALQNLELQEHFWEEVPEEAGQFVQTQYDHEDDTEDIPDGFDPIALHKERHHTFNQDIGDGAMSLVQSMEDVRQQEQADEVQAIMDKQAQEDSMKIQIGQTGFIPHEDDTEDMALDQSPAAYDYHHSKAWNDQVNKKAQQIENEMKIEENTKIAKKKAAEMAKQRAAEERVKAAALAKKKAQERANEGSHSRFQTVDFAELYAGIPAQENVQINESAPYEHHSKFVQNVNWKADALAEQQQQQAEYEEAHPDQYKPVAHFQTVDQGELYDGMALQESYEHHSQKWYQHEAQMEKLVEQQNREDEAAEKANQASAATIQKFGMNPETLEVRHPNPDVNLNEEYGGFGSFVQLSFDHELDSDDIVPEFSEAVKVPVEKKEEKEMKTDFNGEHFEEFYDE